MNSLSIKLVQLIAACACVGAAAPAAAQDSVHAPVASTVQTASAVEVASVGAYATAAVRHNGSTDNNFRAIHAAWTQMDGPRTVAAAVSIPAGQPVTAMRLTSDFGSRSDPFNGRMTAHKGVDIPGAIGTPIYATADGVVAKAEWFGGYGKYVQIEHGNAIQTRYGHMSAINVAAGQHVKRGQVIGYMGSTGRSTGSHLHYEVRIDGDAVNPMPFIQTNQMTLAARDSSSPALGGPAGN